MKALYALLGLALSSTLPLAAQAAGTTWTVTDAEFRITANPEDYLVDTRGVFGEVGRKLLLSDIRGRLDPSGPATLTLADERYLEFQVKQYHLSAAYALDYTLRDFETGEQVAAERAVVRIESHSEYLPDNPAALDGNFRATVGGLNAGGSDRLIHGLSYWDDFSDEPLYTPFTATGAYPGDFTLNYGGGLVVALADGLEHRVFTPDQAYRPEIYAFAGTATLTPAIPEPETYALMAMGLAGVALSRRLKRRLPA